MSNTPAYQGSSQPAGNGKGWLGRIGSFFGGSTPAYAGGDQSPASSGGFLGVATPAYKPAPVAKPQEAPSAETTAVAQAAASCPGDPDPFGSGPIAIIVPRQGF